MQRLVFQLLSKCGEPSRSKEKLQRAALTNRQEAEVEVADLKIPRFLLGVIRLR